MTEEKWVIKCEVCGGVVEGGDGYDWTAANKRRQIHFGRHPKIEQANYKWNTMTSLVPHAALNLVSHLD